MKVKKVELHSYRNYSHLSLEFSSNLNVIVGNNAQGKTNLLEAIYFCSVGKSFRVSKEKEVISWKEKSAKIKLDVEKKHGKNQIEILFSNVDKKTIKINHIPIKKIGELIGELCAVFFSPDELKIVKDAPGDRRRFMDIDLSQTSKHYFYQLGKYEKILQNRNKLLKNSNNNIENLKRTISIWNEQLAEVGSDIIFCRQKFISELQPYALLAHEYLTDGKEKISLSYTEYSSTTKEDLKNELLSLYEKNMEKDINLGYTSVGPHRDDIKIVVNDIDIRTYGSQGQQRTVALSLKLAELEIIHTKTGEMPILILDDVLSELDMNRKNKLLNFAKKTQTFISCTNFDSDKHEANIIKIEDGKVKY